MDKRLSQIQSPVRRAHVMQFRTRWFLLGLLALFLAYVFVDSMGVFDHRPYNEVPHGSHSHYVPKDCDPPLSVGNSPTQRPGPNETVDCSGRIVPITPE